MSLVLSALSHPNRMPAACSTTITIITATTTITTTTAIAKNAAFLSLSHAQIKPHRPRLIHTPADPIRFQHRLYRPANRLCAYGLR